MDFHDFEKFNGQDLLDIFEVNKEKSSYNHEVGLLGGTEIQIRYEDDYDEADVRLMDGKLIGHVTIGRNIATNKQCWIFEASDKEWT